MARAILIVLDSVGIGGAPDAAAYHDEGADTLGHIAQWAAAGKADRPGLRQGPLRLPHMDGLGLGHAHRLATGHDLPGLGQGTPRGLWGCAAERSSGKDTPSGHWEIAGVPVPFEWTYFPETVPCFPPSLTDAIIAQAQLPGILGNCHASGTEIIARLGEEHIRTGKPILYTSADSVLQIAAHETHFGLERLYALCLIARRLTQDMNLGRIIARPFVGESAESFERTANRRDYAVPPPAPTLLELAQKAGRQVLTVGKIADIYAHQGPTRIAKAAGNMALVDATLAAIRDAQDGDLVMANIIDFDQLYGHRRDVPGYAAALEAFDARLPEIEALLRPGDLVVLTADHGCDPTWRGTDHTREQVPILAFGPGLPAGTIGARESYADIGQTLARHLAIPAPAAGVPFL